MLRLMRSSFYKLFRDKTFHIVLAIGIIVAVAMPLIYLAIDLTSGSNQVGVSCNGYNLLISTVSPVQNFGIAIPINLITFIIGEFNYGTIRNKIIAGNRRSYIYFSLFLNGLVFSFILLFLYMGLATLVATCIGGFSYQPLSGSDVLNLLQVLLITILVYTTLTSLCVFISTLFRNIGPSISITVIIMMIGFIVAMIYTTTSNLGSIIRGEALEFDTAMLILNPMFLMSIMSLGLGGLGEILSVNNIFIYQILSCLLYASIFYLLGNLGFKLRDIK